ncbi:MAG: EAL domain-containing protein [Gammaproteobacteria bacterium]|nr:EAL domain-containing protein [Gammaproteobacteria bacterium]
MKLFRTYSLSSYMISTIVFVHALLAPILFSVILNVYSHSSSELFITHANNIAGILADDLSNKHYSRQRDTLLNILDSAVLSGNIVFIDIQDELQHSLKPSDQLAISSRYFIEDYAIGQNDDAIYFLSVPVSFSGAAGKNFKLRIGFDEAPLNEQITSIKERMIIIILIYIFSMISFFTLITHYIHKPLKLLRQKSNTIAQGDFDSALKVASSISDIKYLSQDLEKMRITLIQMASNMQVQATHDELTGLPNRYLYTDRMHQAVSLSQRTNQSFALLLLDLDRFKEINDTLGHGLGDKVLQVLAKRMHESMRESDTIARIGGDEFSVILINVDQATASAIAKKMIRLIEPIIDVDGHTLNATASIGIAIYPEHGLTPELLLQHADIAMYNAKNNNLSTSIYHADMDSDNYEKLILVNDFKNSIDQNHFKSLFQPKLNLQTGEVCGCELLLRWNHPTLGLICPDRFIPLAEQENLIADLTCWATHQSLRLLRDIVLMIPDFNLSINVSPINLLDSTLLSSLLDIISGCDFPIQNLTIEITENVIMKNPVRSAEILNKFSESGIKISIDDFGTGYSSLAYLQKFPISELKIDKTFITDLTVESANYPIVKASITMAHDLGISVVAEGIETIDVHHLLKELKCDKVQGFFYGLPMSFNELQNWLEEHAEINQLID